MRKLSQTVEQEESQFASMDCAAYGCGLKGTLSAGTDGKSRFYCRFHFNIKPSLNDQVTFKIHQNEKLMKLFDICTTPEKYFKGDKNTTFFAKAEKFVSDKLHEMGLDDLFVQRNLIKTRRLIIQELDARTKVEDHEAMPMPAGMDVGNHYLDKFR